MSSEMIMTNIGLSRGSMLDPILLVFYINDWEDVVGNVALTQYIRFHISPKSCESKLTIDREGDDAELIRFNQKNLL